MGSNRSGGVEVRISNQISQRWQRVVRSGNVGLNASEFQVANGVLAAIARKTTRLLSEV
jgi:hypothetical protein